MRQQQVSYAQYFHSFTTKDCLSQDSTTVLNSILKNVVKQVVPCESTAEEVSFEWSHHRILSSDTKVRAIYKTIASCESSAEEVSFEWSHHRILSSDSFSSGIRWVNDPYSDLEFRFYSSSFNLKNSFNFKSSELRQVGTTDWFRKSGTAYFWKQVDGAYVI